MGVSARSMRPAALALVLAVVPACLTGCGAEPGPPTAADDGQEPTSIIVDLRAQGSSRQRGTATLAPVDGRRTRVTIDLAGAPSDEQPARLRRGTCEREGEVVHELQPVRSRLSDTTVYRSLEELVGDEPLPLVLDVRKAGDGEAVACGVLPEQTQR